MQRSLFSGLYLSIFGLFARLGAEDSIGVTAFNGNDLPIEIIEK